MHSGEVGLRDGRYLIPMNHRVRARSNARPAFLGILVCHPTRAIGAGVVDPSAVSISIFKLIGSPNAFVERSSSIWENVFRFLELPAKQKKSLLGA